MDISFSRTSSPCLTASHASINYSCAAPFTWRNVSAHMTNSCCDINRPRLICVRVRVVGRRVSAFDFVVINSKMRITEIELNSVKSVSFNFSHQKLIVSNRYIRSTGRRADRCCVDFSHLRKLCEWPHASSDHSNDFFAIYFSFNWAERCSEFWAIAASHT